MKRNKSYPLHKSETLTGYLFILPSLICLIFLSLLPVLLCFALSLTNWNMVSSLSHASYVGAKNYIWLLSDNEFLTSLKNNFLFAFMTIPVQIVGGFFIAVLINKNCYGRNIFRATYFLPYISSTVAISTVWMVLFQPSYGPINQILHAIGVANPPKWLADTHWALPSLAAMYSWQNIGYDIIIFMAALQTVPIELYESAEMDGANWFAKTLRITVPMVSPTTFFLIITEIMASFRVFDQVSVVTKGGPAGATSVLVYYLYKISFTFNKVGYGAAITIVLFLLIFIITFVQWKGRNKWVQS